jgi:hypothetical protein
MINDVKFFREKLQVPIRRKGTRARARENIPTMQAYLIRLLNMEENQAWQHMKHIGMLRNIL